ncbi:YrbL family protein [Kangiella sp. TOML190]|uniref:YrbL family protein n=1 Tax=Kangiella sp. TOML190 TaxID=2931351 RepID=UPI00203B4646|nr:YrbL family protein [Kangiella sp. TOML190]
MIIPEENYMGKGVEKVVYRHPHDENICIKFPNKEKPRALSHIQREVYYLEKHQQQLLWLAPYLGKVKCNLGDGYMYQIVRNEDGSLSNCISDRDIENHLESIKEKIALMYSQLIEQHAVVNDLNLGNFFFRKKKDDFDLILIDGFGNNNFIKIADYSKYFLIKKLNRKFNKLCTKLNIASDFLI